MTHSINRNEVQRWIDRYHAKSVKEPNLYVGEGNINVGLPISLIEWANAAGGHSGFKSGARPTGIRFSVSNPVAKIKEIFSSVDNFIAFIKTSDCSGPAWAAGEYAKYVARTNGVAAVSRCDNRPATEVWDSLYKEYDIPALAAKFGKDALLAARQFLTVDEFKLRFHV